MDHACRGTKALLIKCMKTLNRKICPWCEPECGALAGGCYFPTAWFLLETLPFGIRCTNFISIWMDSMPSVKEEPSYLQMSKARLIPSPSAREHVTQITSPGRCAMVCGDRHEAAHLSRFWLGLRGVTWKFIGRNGRSVWCFFIYDLLDSIDPQHKSDVKFCQVCQLLFAQKQNSIRKQLPQVWWFYCKWTGSL